MESSITLETLKSALERWKKALETVETEYERIECRDCIRALNIRIARWENPAMTTRELNRIY